MSDEQPTRVQLGDLVAGLAAASPSPGAGSVAACVVALSAGLVEMVAGRSAHLWPEAPGAVAQAELLQARIIPLVQENAVAYAAALAALRQPGDRNPDEAGGELGAHLEQAAAVPLLIAEVGADVAEIAAVAAAKADPDLQADAVGAAVLAEAATRAAARLVEVNLGMQREDWRRSRAWEAADRARVASDRATATGSD